MNKFMLSGPQLPQLEQMSHRKSVVFIGSCFSDHMAGLFEYAGFQVFSNPFGTAYHPSVLARHLEYAGNKKPVYHGFESNDIHYDWLSGHQIYGQTEAELKQLLDAKYQDLYRALEHSSHVFITLGTAFGYRLRSDGLLVANCHKQAAGLFDKELTPLIELLEVWRHCLKLLFEQFPHLNIVFTVSPVRHIRDGLTMNNRSKARLFELLSCLELEFADKSVQYFPAYEIIMDELRDYRFFEADLIHPNNVAAKYIFDQLLACGCSEHTRQLIKEVLGLRKLQAHRSISTTVSSKQRFEEEVNQKIQVFLAAHPEVNW